MTQPEDKLRPLDALTEECAIWREQGLAVVLVNGAFDVLHVGHLRYLAAARELGDRLVAAVNSDLSVQLSKGERRPIIPEIERVEILASIIKATHLSTNGVFTLFANFVKASSVDAPQDI